ncbi:hypothetical protein PPACK8108_LOCUS3806 [Phakopsora pachyrhizi]|uniref:Uncharacterized protein n=1 Tax=Phakopsora pachyrhizi TaxID=170000 RepID=A0AAV0AKR0_PHAPC|nr:hypothetical protein PPACK8108_LOCUS3806 [Phakopsora pachyrhizi]
MVFSMKVESPKVYKRKQDMINGLEVRIEELVIGLFAGMVSVDQSQSRSRTALQKPVRNTVRPNTFHPITISRVTRARRITMMVRLMKIRKRLPVTGGRGGQRHWGILI